MVIDTSAIVAILGDEPERRCFTEAIAGAASRRMSVASLVEASIVIEVRYGTDGLRDLDALIERAAIGLVAVDLDQARLARHAFSRFGKGRHPAGLNFGDGFSYALARSLGETLLFKGSDFARTDISAAVPPVP